MIPTGLVVKIVSRIAIATIASKLINSIYKKASSLEPKKILYKKTPIDKIFDKIEKSVYIEIQGTSYKIIGRLDTEKEKFLYVENIFINPIEERVFDLSVLHDLTLLQNAKFYELNEI